MTPTPRWRRQVRVIFVLASRDAGTLAAASAQAEALLQWRRRDGRMISPTRFIIDDFGTGYSNMGFLKHFPLDVLKIDRAFIHHVDRNQSDGAICRPILELAHNLSLQAVAEGVERPEELEYLRSIGCDTAQGYLLGRPAPARALTSTLPRPTPARPRP